MKILVVGASARAVAESVARAGHEPVAADAFGDRDLRKVASWRRLKDADAVIPAALDIDVDGVVFASGVENDPGVVDELRAKGVRVFAPEAEAIRRSRAARDLMEICGRRGIARPRIFLSPPEGSRCLVKPFKSGAGMGVRDWDGDLSSVGPGEYLQERIDGTPLSAVFVANAEDAVILGVSRQFAGEAFLGADGYAWCGNLMPFDGKTERKESLLGELRRIVVTLARELKLSGACGIDFILRGETPWLLEINPRICASFELVEMLRDVNVFELHLRALNGELPEEPAGLLNGPFCGKGIVYAPRDMTAPDTDTWLGTNRRDIPQANSRLPEGLPICTLVSPPMKDGPAVVGYLSAEARRVWGECA